MKTVTSEDLSRAPVGAIVITEDGCIAFRRYGRGKTEWERVVPHPPEGWISARPPERGSRIFISITRLLQREPMVFEEY